MFYKINENYYIKLYDGVYRKVEIEKENDNINIKPTKTKLEVSGRTRVQEMDLNTLKKEVLSVSQKPKRSLKDY